MAERFGKPLPQIARFPDEPKLTGAPHRAQDSVFLSTPGLTRAMEAVADTKDLKSQQRRGYIANVDQEFGRKPRQRANLVEALGSLSGNELTESSEIRRSAQLLYDRLRPREETEDEVVTYSFNDELFDTLQVTERFGESVTMFGEYLSGDAKRRRTVLNSHAASFLRDPQTLARLALKSRDIEAMAGEESGMVNAYVDYNSELVDEMLTMTDRPEMVKMEGTTVDAWMRLYSYDTAFAEVGTKVLGDWLSIDDLNVRMDRLYQLATAAYTSEDDVLTHRMMEITGFQTPLIPFDSRAAIEYNVTPLLGTRTASNQFHDIHIAEAYIGMNNTKFAGLALQGQRRRRQQVDSEENVRLRSELVDRYVPESGITQQEWQIRQREVRKVQFFKRLGTKRSVTHGEDMILADTPLRAWVNEKQAEFNQTKRLENRPWLGRAGRNRLTAQIYLPDLAYTVKAPVDEISHSVREKLATLSGHEFDQPAHIRTLALVVPESIDQRKIDALNEANDEMRREIAEDRLRSISPRGDMIHVTSEQLKSLGFTAVEVHPVKGNGYNLRITVGENVFAATMDKNWKFVKNDFGAPLTIPITGAFLEHVVISHVHELMCAPAEDGGNGNEGTNEFYSRRDHQYRLPEGRKPSQEQIRQIKIDYGIDIEEKNKARKAAGEKRLITWHRAVERIDKTGTGPVESFARNATQQLDQIFVS